MSQTQLQQTNATHTILIVENDEATLELLALTIDQETSFQAHSTCSARQALHMARHLVPDLLLLDYNLSSMTGIQLYDQLHKIPELQHIPAILMSASLERYEQELQQRNLSGLNKPFELDEFIRTIEEAMQRQ